MSNLLAEVHLEFVFYSVGIANHQVAGISETVHGFEAADFSTIFDV